MFDENKYRTCFDKVLAPQGIEKEILNMTINKNNNAKTGLGRRMVFVAAVLALTLALGVAASAAGWFNIGDAIVGRLDMPEDSAVTVLEDGENSADAADFICLQGIKGSPEYEATKEWFDFYWSDEYEVVSREEAIIDPVYNLYGAFSQKNIDKLDSICEKHGLKLCDSLASVSENDISALYEAVGCHGLLKHDAGHDFLGGYWYQGGSFKIEGRVTLAEGWDKPIDYAVMNYAKGYLANGGYLKLGAAEDCVQWDYTTSDGVTVTIIHAETRDILLINLENSTLAVNVVDIGEYSGGRSKNDMEAFAECFDFSAVK